MSTQNASADHIPTLDATGTTTAQLRRQVGWGLWLQWVLANGLGWALGSSALWIIAKIPFIALVAILLSFGVGWAITFGAISGASFGLMQRFILHRRGYPVHRWVLASWVGGAIGGAISGIAFWIISQSVGGFARLILFLAIPFMTLVGLITGMVVGIQQQRVWRRQRCSVKWWALANAIGWALGCTLSEVVGEVLLHTSEAVNAFTAMAGPLGERSNAALHVPFWPFSILSSDLIPITVIAIVCGLTGGAITGIPLVRMLRQSESISS